MLKNLNISLILLVIFIVSCSKENSSSWEVEESGIVVQGDYLILTHNDNYSNIRPYSLGKGSKNKVWEEDHILHSSFFRNEDCYKQIIIEIPDNTVIDKFSYFNTELFDSLKVAVFHDCNSKYDGYYRIHNGTISGQKINGEWVIDFSVIYGGKDGDKFRMIKDAAY
ncbi:MAG: hypothetical protein K9J13_12245 [Saprospiraceae bacterium]|nr:hypothetical protein [Saprospiraceae bacterium]